MEAVDVDEGFPLARDAADDLVKQAKVVLAGGADEVDRGAVPVGHFPAEREKKILEVGLDPILDGRLLIQDDAAVGALVTLFR